MNRHTLALALALIPSLSSAAPEPPKPDDAPAGNLQRATGYVGAAAFPSVGALTVVYPAGPGEPVARNRQSAEARARWLTLVHKNRVEVAADDQLTEEQRRGNLLVLGWSNRFFGPTAIPRPFRHDANGLAFLGLVEADPSVDLLLFHRNPANWESFLLFWSRMDPERDRLSVLPRVGSDWAIYQDFRAVRQGMFKPGRVWPPVRETQAEADHTARIADALAGLAVSESAHYRIHYPRANFKDADVRAILNAREAAYKKVTQALGTPRPEFRIRLFVFEDDAAKKQLTGIEDPAHAVPGARELDMTRRFARSTSPHEDVHVVARELFGPSSLTATYEGLALAVENSWRGDSMEVHAAIARSAGSLPELALVLDEERLRAYPNESGFLAAGIFMTWLRQTYGIDGVRKAYGLTVGTPAALATALGVREETLAASYTAWADACVTAHRADLDYLAAAEAASERELAADWPGTAVAWRRALAAKPGDPQTLFNLALAEMRADELDRAESTLRTLLGVPLAAGDSRFKIFGHFQLGRVYDLLGRRDAALVEYGKVLALPDEHGAHALARERQTSPATREQLE